MMGSGWTEQQKSSSLEECMESFDADKRDLATKICPCVLEKLERKYPNYNEGNSNQAENDVKTYALQCKDEVVGNNENNTTTYTWSKSDEDQWMSACSESVGEKLGEEQRTSYCSCIMEKLKGMFSSFNEVNTKGSQTIGIELGKKCSKELGIGE
jgi:hypothetical protein